MAYVECEVRGGVALVTMARGKVNAIDSEMVDQLDAALSAIESDPNAGAVVLTGRGSFFSFGFDVPELFPFSRESFAGFLASFTALYTRMFTFPKPVVAALNGHAVAGGCMLALTADYRVMASGRARIALNEIGFRSAVFAGSVEMLRFLAGSANAAKVLYSGSLYTAGEALDLGLVEEKADEGEVVGRALQIAGELGAKAQPAFAEIKRLLRGPVADEITRLEPDSLRRFVDIWYSEATRESLRSIVIR